MKPLTAVEPRIGTEEWQARVELAACYRLLAHFGLDDLTYNHLSVRVPGEPDRLLVKPSSFFFDEVTASNLLKFSLDGTPHQAGAPNRGGAHVIHAGILGARPDLNAVFHTHTVAGAAVPDTSQPQPPRSGRIAPCRSSLFSRRLPKEQANAGRHPPKLPK